MSEPRRHPAVAVVVEHEGRVLVVRRAQGRTAAGYWTPVTGAVEPGESFEEACVREVAEEVGLAIEVVSREVFRCPVDGVPGWFLVWFRAALAPGQDPSAIVLAERELAEAHWVAPALLDTLSPMFDDTRRGFVFALEPGSGDDEEDP